MKTAAKVTDRVWVEFRPQTPVESQILAECVERIVSYLPVASRPAVAEVLADASRYWLTAGRSAYPRKWRSQVAAAERLIARGELIAECDRMGIDPFVEIDGFARMNAEQLRDELTYLGDYQG